MDGVHDLTRSVLGVLFIAVLIAACFWILSPFLLSAVWATMIVVASWPFMLWLQAWLWNRRSLAVLVLTVLLLLGLVVPLWFAVAAVVDHAEEIAGWAKSLATMTLPPPPPAVSTIPLVGDKIAKAWTQWIGVGAAELLTRFAPYMAVAVKWFAAQAGSIGVTTIQFLLTVIIAAILYARGETVVHGVMLFGRRLAGPRGENSVRLAGQAIRGVALGVVVTAVAQAVFAGIGLAVTGVPFAAILTVAMLILAIAQIGPFPVLVAAIFWMYWKSGPFWGTVLLIWSIPAVTLDNLLRPILIKRGADLPLLLIFTGVIGGLTAFGLVGIFVGPVVLAVSYTLLQDWVSAEPSEPHPSSGAAGT